MPLAGVPVNCGPGCGDECEYASVRVTLDTEFFCWCYVLQPQDFSCCRIWVTLDTVYNCQCYAFICWNGLEVEGLLQVVFLEIPPNCIRGEEYSSSPDQLHAFWGNANLYLSTALCIKLNSSKIHSSNNNIAVCAAPFIPLHALQLLVQRIHSLTFKTLSALSISHAAYSAHMHFSHNAGTFWIKDPTQRSCGS